jgi:GPH family glycoside/pentoside/hexuronide:cation symporter
MPRTLEKLPFLKVIVFALGQLGWSLASYGVGNLVNYFYMPPDMTASVVFPPFIYQGAIAGVVTVIGAITFVGRAFDAVANPLIASWSDRSSARIGRRRWFMLVSAVPFSLFSVLVFIPLRHFSGPPSLASSWANAAWLAAAVLAFYFFFVMYTTSYNALISELGHTPHERLLISTMISVAWALGFGIGIQVYQLQGIFERSGMSSVSAFRTVQMVFGGLSLVLMLLPVAVIDERRYAVHSASKQGTIQALRAVLRNRNFCLLLLTELLYFVCQTLMLVGLVYYVVTLLKLDKEVTSVLLPVMFVLSFAFYYPVVKAAARLGKKRVLLTGLLLLILLFLFFALMGVLPVRALPYAYAVAVFAALPMATLGIIPNAIVADIAEADGIETGDFKAAMFFAIRAFVDNLGMAIANMLFAFFLTLGKSVANPAGLRVSAVVSLCVCVLAAAVFSAYDEGAVLRSLQKKESSAGGEGR